MRRTKKDEAFDILKSYSGKSPYILGLKKIVYIDGNFNIINDFNVDYILSNKDYSPTLLNRITEVCDWYGEKLKEKFSTDFIPTKLKVVSCIGETKDYYHCYIKYRQSAEPVLLFLPKNAILKNFFVNDYNDLTIDFDRYDRISTEKDPDRKLKDTQKTAIKFLLSRKKCILADDMGMGKTTSMAVASIEGNFDRVLIICPASIKSNWKKELMWYVDEKDITIVESFIQKTKPELEKFLGYAEGKSKMTREELLEEAKNTGKWQNNRFVIINYDILDEFYTFPVTWSKDNIEKAFDNSPILKYINNRKSLIIVDEAHRFSKRDSNRFKVVKDLIKRGKPDSVYLATGTPITNNPENLFCVLQFLDDPIKDNWEYYSDRYCGAMKIPAKGEKAKWEAIFLKKKNKKTWFDLSNAEKEELKKFISANARKIRITKDATNLDELQKRISHIYLRRVKEDLDEMPNKTIHEAKYELTEEQKKEYDILWDEYETAKKEENPDKDVNKDLLEGAVYRKYISDIMLPYTERIVNYWLKKGEKVVVACCYDDELYNLRDYYGDRCVIYNGKMNTKQKDNAVDLFMNDDSKVVFIGNINAAGVGITLTSSSKLVFNNMSFVPGDNQQMEDRICRIGQKKDCDIYYQYFLGTQYEHMWNTVLSKSAVIDQVIKKETDK